MELWSVPRRWLWGSVQAVGLGVLAASAEILGLAGQSRLPLSSVDVLVLGAVNLVLVGGAAWVAGLISGLVHGMRGDRPAYRAVALQLAVASGLLLGLWLWPWARHVYDDGRAAVGVVLALLPLGAVGVVLINARFWLARKELGKAPAVGFLPICVGLGLSGIGLASLAWAPATPALEALDDDPSVLLVTVDGLRADALAPGSSVQTPALDALMARGFQLRQAVTPSTHAGPAHAALLTGLHPLRARMFSDDHALPRGAKSLPVVLGREGWHSAAFVSRDAVGAASGLDRGFAVFDDDLDPRLRGLGLLRLGRMIAAPAAQRAGERTVDRFRDWFATRPNKPFFAWVHLADTMPPFDDDHAAVLRRGLPVEDDWPGIRQAYEARVEDVDAAVGRVISALEEGGWMDRTFVVFASSMGVALGEAGPYHHRGLDDVNFHVPAILLAPAMKARDADPRPAIGPGVLEPQVRLWDLPATITGWIGLDAFESAEGADLALHLSGERKVSLGAVQIGQGRGDTWMVGLRTPEVRVERDVDGASRVVHAGEPIRSDDEVRQWADGLLAGEAAALRRLLQGQALRRQGVAGGR